MLHDYAGIGLMVLVGLVFPIIPLVLSFLLQTRRPTPQKMISYECGVDTIGPTWVRYRNSYFLYALVFVVFDVETVFLYPWAVKFQALGLFALVEMFIFIALLVVGLWYAWKKGALEWN